MIILGYKKAGFWIFFWILNKRKGQKGNLCGALKVGANL